MRFHPAISILLGIISAIIFSGIFFGISILACSATAWTMGVAILFGVINGGFIVTHFTKERRIKYGTYAGIIFAIAIIVSFGKPQQYDIISYNLLLLVFFALIVINGIYIEKNDSKKAEFNIDKYFKGL